MIMLMGERSALVGHIDVATYQLDDVHGKVRAPTDVPIDGRS